jgi:hypothetical protein
MANATAKKITFDFNNDKYQAYWNGKEYGQGKVYFSATRVGGTYETKGSYSKQQESFIDYKAGELDLVRATAKALGFIQ